MDANQDPHPIDSSVVESAASTPAPDSAPAALQSCQTCRPQANGAMPQSASRFVYAIGRIEPRFPSLAIEKELAQIVGRAETVNLTDRQAMHKVLSARENRYLARQLCWLLTVQGLDTYVLYPRDVSDLELLTGALRPSPNDNDIDVVIGVHGGLAPPEMCNGEILPLVLVDQVYSFDHATFVKAIPRADGVDAKSFGPAVQETFQRVLQMTGNAGTSDEHRALNYLAVRYPTLYSVVAEAFAANATLSAVDVRRAAVGGPRTVLEVILSFTDRRTDVQTKQSVRVDVTEEFPFLVSKLAPYFDH